MKKRHYELTTILKPEGGNEAIRQFVDRVDGIISDYNGNVINLASWGERKLAYEIKKNLKGHYLFFDLVGNGELIDELERNFNIWEGVLKYMTIVVDEAEDIEELEKNARGVASLFEKEERKPVEKKVEKPVEKKEEKKTIDDSRKYNEELQKSLDGAEEDDDEKDVEL